jgi:hypothetical protein
MKKALLGSFVLLLSWQQVALARGVSPYLPLQLEPEIERQIERVLILADKPILTRPIAAATVLEALPEVCPTEPLLCQQVRSYLERFMRRTGIGRLGAEGASSEDLDDPIPNQRGLRISGSWRAMASAYYQPSDYALLSLGAVADDEQVVPTGTLLSLGWDRAQLDIGYRDHWLSPFTDSSMLVSSDAPTMPSVTLSNYVPLTRLALHYEVFAARMSRSDNIAFLDEIVSGKPRITGVHLSMEPAIGWSVGVNRILQFGGGPRTSDAGDVLRAFFSPSRFDNQDFTLDPAQEFGNQLASITSRFLFPNDPQFAVYFEYAGEDTSYGKNLLLGNSSISAGIDLPRLWRRFEFTYETTDWQNAWYDHHIYRDGLANDGLMIGHWFGNARVRRPGESPGGTTHMARLGWRAPFREATLELRARTISVDGYFGDAYQRGKDFTLRYSQPLGPLIVGGEVYTGSDVLGQDFTRFALFMRLGDGLRGTVGAFSESFENEATPFDADVFVTAGVQASRVRVDLDNQIPVVTTSLDFSPRLGIGARRRVSDRSDLGARLEVSKVNDISLVAVRALDYRYRFRNDRLALSGFLGAARYDLDTVAQGLYAGIGAQWRDVLPGWDVDFDLSCAFKVARDDLLPSDPAGGRPDSFYDIYGATLALSRRF